MLQPISRRILHPVFLALALALALWPGRGVAAAGAPYWNWRNPLPHGNDFNAVTFGGGRFVAVGRAGSINTSPNGIDWTPAYSQIQGELSSVAYGNGRFVAVGFQIGGVLTSLDGVSWARSEVAGAGEWRKATSVAFVGDRFFAMSPTPGYVATSTDGLTWTFQSDASAHNVVRIAQDAGAYLALDGATGKFETVDGTNWTVVEARTVRSTDGTAWTEGGRTGLATVAGTPVYLGDRWLLLGTQVTTNTAGVPEPRTAISVSRDGGLTWQVTWHDPSSWGSQRVPGEPCALFGDALHFLQNNGTVASTADGETVSVDATLPVGLPNGLAAGAGRIVAIGRYGLVTSSADGKTWVTHSASTVKGDLFAAAFGDGRWIVAGNRGLAASTDAIDWSMLSAGGQFTAGTIAFGNDRFVATAENGDVGVSTDQGETWTVVAHRSGPARRIVFTAGRFIACETRTSADTGAVVSQLVSSIDGVDWSEGYPVPGGVGYWSGVTVVGDVAYAYGSTDPVQESGGVIARSTDGLTWTAVLAPAARIAAVGGHDQFIAATTYADEVWTSTDGVTWVRSEGRPLAGAGPVSALTWIGDRLVGSTYFGKIVTSPDGLTWGVEDFAGSGMIRDLAVGGGHALAVGNGGAIWEVGTARFVNNSSRAHVGQGEDLLVAGLVIAGEGPKQVLVRAAGPALAGRGVAGVLAAPVLSVFRRNGALLASNQDWRRAGQPAALAAAARQVGAFAFDGTSADSALLLTLDPGVYTAQITGADASTGVAMVEVYDVAGPGSRLVNLATRSRVGSGDDILISGFVVTGDAPKTVLVRGVGPALVPMGVVGALDRPVLKVLRGSTVLDANTGWNTAPNREEIAAAARKVGAFALPSDGADSALLLQLTPGSYTVHVSGLGGATGVAVAEVYELP